MTTKEKDEASRFAEFLSVMAPRKNRAVEEEMVVASAPVVKSSFAEAEAVAAVVESARGKDEMVEDEEISDMEYMERRRKRMREGEDEEGGQAWVQDEADGGVPVVRSYFTTSCIRLWTDGSLESGQGGCSG